MTANELRRIRADGKLTRKELAGLLGVSIETVVSWENNRSSISRIAEIAIKSVMKARK